MDWIGFAVVSMICWALVQIVDKTLIATEAPTYRHYLFVSGLASVPVVIFGPAVLAGSFTRLPVHMLLLTVVTGMCYFIGNGFVFYAFTVLDASIVAAALAAVPACAAVASWLALGEKLRVLPVIGLALITIGVVGMNGPRDKSGQGPSRRSAWLAVAGAVAALVTEYVIEGFAVEKVPSGVVFYWGRVGVVAAVLALAAVRRSEAADAIAWVVRRRRVVLALSFGNEALDMVAIACLIAAYAYGPVGLATGIAYANPALVFLLTVMVNRLRVGAIPSEGDDTRFAWRALGVTVVVTGVLLASVSATST